MLDRRSLSLPCQSPTDDDFILGASDRGVSDDVWDRQIRPLVCVHDMPTDPPLLRNTLKRQ
jgi:hypothetical protein